MDMMKLKKLGSEKLDGRVITDDSYFDFLPVHAKWLWEDPGVIMVQEYMGYLFLTTHMRFI